jgi:hypothetical protein
MRKMKLVLSEDGKEREIEIKRVYTPLYGVACEVSDEGEAIELHLGTQSINKSNEEKIVKFLKNGNK